jgi:hypothetical protein
VSFIGDNTSELIQLFPVALANFSLGFWALDGDDTVDGSGASELILGNQGEDILRGSAGNDSVFGGKGKDALFGGEGNDSLSGGLDADRLLGSAGDDILLGGRGNDLLSDGEGNNTLVGGLGRDFFECGFDNNNLCVLGIDPATTDINSSDIIEGFDPDLDRIGLASDLTVNDIVLEPVQNVALTYTFDGPQALQPLLPPGPAGAFSGSASRTQPRGGITGVYSGTLIRVKNSNAILAFVDDVTPNELQSRIVSVQGF